MQNNNFNLNHINEKNRLFELSINDTIKKTYLLLSFCLLLSIMSACIGIIINYQVNFILFMAFAYGSLHIMEKHKDNYKGLFALLFFVSFMGFSLGRFLNSLMFQHVNGGEIIGISLALTSLVFFSLSAYALITKKNFNYLEGFIGIASVIILFLFIIQMFYFMPILHLFLSGCFALFSSAMILYTTSNMIYERGERNYILITASLFLNIYNLFTSFLFLLSFFGGSGSKE
jgi:modulator of FtsH protease